MEDEDEDRELQDNVEEESDIAPPSTQPRHRKSQASNTSVIDKGKGKGRSLHKTGPLSDAAKEEAQEFGHEVMDNADWLADWWKTSWCSILIAASLMLRESCAPNPANKHSEWYTASFPKKDGGKRNLDLYVDTYWMYCSVSLELYRHMIHEDYQKWTAGLSEEEKTQNMQEIWDWVDNLSIGIVNMLSYKSVTARMIGMQNQLTTLVSYLTSIQVLYW